MVHKGIFRRRLKHNPREKAFADLWESENANMKAINHGFGQLQDLFISTDKYGWIRRFVFKITQREAVIVATVIQWFGSNCGMGFLHKALNDCGYVIVPKKEITNADSYKP